MFQAKSRHVIGVSVSHFDRYLPLDDSRHAWTNQDYCSVNYEDRSMDQDMYGQIKTIH